MLKGGMQLQMKTLIMPTCMLGTLAPPAGNGDLTIEVSGT